MPKLEAKPTWERTPTRSPNVGVDRANNVIRGVVIAQAGPFKTTGRGEFDERSLREIVRLTNKARNGLKSRLAHPTLSDDGIGKLVGHVRNARLDSATIFRDGKPLTVPAVRADLHISPTSRKTPSGDLGGYVMDLAEQHPESFSSSLVLQADKEQRLDAKGRPQRDDKGQPLPPLWRPTAIHASDIVDTGDAADGFLSANGKPSLSIEGLPDALARRAAAALDEQFAGMSRAEIRRRVEGFLQKYIDWKYGEPKDSKQSRQLEIAKHKVACGLNPAPSKPAPSKASRLTGRDAKRLADAFVERVLRPPPAKLEPAPPPPHPLDERIAKARWRCVNCLFWQQGEAVAELNRLERLKALSADEVSALAKRRDSLRSSLRQTSYGMDGWQSLEADLYRVEQDLAELGA